MADKLISCKTCGAEISASAKTCPSCGAKLENDGSKFCQNCGRPL